MRPVLLATVLLTVLSSLGEAQPRFALGGNAALAVPTSTDLDAATDADLSITGAATIELTAGLAIRGEIGRHELTSVVESFDFCDALGIRCAGDIRFTNYSAGLQYGGSVDRGAFGMNSRRFLPYVFGTAGAYHVEQEVLERFVRRFTFSADIDANGAQQPSLVNVARTKFGMSAGGGLNVRVSEHVLIQADMHVHGVNARSLLLASDTPSSGWQWFVTPTVGLWVGF
jgi:hypothetical protein